MDPDSLDDQWRRFFLRTMPSDAPPIQRSAMEDAFKTGAASILLEMRGPVADLPEEEGVKVLQRWLGEYEYFILQRVKAYQREHSNG